MVDLDYPRLELVVHHQVHPYDREARRPRRGWAPRRPPPGDARAAGRLLLFPFGGRERATGGGVGRVVLSPEHRAHREEGLDARVG